jgi:signal transduction histidine kinase
MAQDGLSSERSPALTLLLGLTITLAAVVSYSWYITHQISGLRTVQRELADRNRRDSLQLLRIQNDLNAIALAMRDMLNADQRHPITAWAAQFQRIRGDLNDAFRQEDKVAVGRRTVEQRQYLTLALGQFWNAIDGTFILAQQGREARARTQIRRSLQAKQASLSNTVARLLVENNESEEQTAFRVGHIYDGVQRQAYLFLCGTLSTILLTSVYLIYSNRKLFAKLSLLSHQRSELARKLISTQESILRHISRDLHDEFGQILTAVGTMLSRMRNRTPQASSIREELQEICEITQATLNNVRSLSQALHPVILEEGGLESALDWYLPNIERQTGIRIFHEKLGNLPSLENSAAIHLYRVLQEALNNAIRHAHASEIWVRLKYACGILILEVEDHGTGYIESSDQPGIGLTGMHERAEILGGQLDLLSTMPAGTLVRLTVPIYVDSYGLERCIV